MHAKTSLWLHRTTKQIDFESERLKDCKMPARAHRPPDSGIMLGSNCMSGVSASKPVALVSPGPAQVRMHKVQSSLYSPLSTISAMSGHV